MWPRHTRPVWQGEFQNPTRHPAAFSSLAPNPNPRTCLTTETNEKHRTHILSIRLTPEEHAVISAMAASANLTTSAFARAAALAAPITVKTYASLAPEEIAQLKRLGNLLNQIARAGWRGRFTRQTDEHLAAVLVELRIAFKTLSRPSLVP